MIPGNESSSPWTSVSPGMPRRGTPSPCLGDGSSWEPDRKRRSKRNADEEETEQWHAAEEAELRTKVPWEPDEALTQSVGELVLLSEINVYAVFIHFFYSIFRFSSVFSLFFFSFTFPLTTVWVI